MATVLIVDDSAFMRGSLRHIVGNAGHEVLGEAKDGAEALELYKQLKPDLVTLDILMRGLDGLEGLVAIMRADPEAKVIMVTALGQAGKEAQARKLGAKGYLRKPFKVDEITYEIERVLNQSQEEE